MSDSFERACAVADLSDEGVLSAEVGGVEVAVVKSEGQYFAIRDECSHAAIALSEGEVDAQECEIECWLHGSRFDLRTGKPSGPPATEAVPTYAVSIVGDDVFVDVASPLDTD